jgi:hypothetical protein
LIALLGLDRAITPASLQPRRHRGTRTSERPPASCPERAERLISALAAPLHDSQARPSRCTVRAPPAGATSVAYRARPRYIRPVRRLSSPHCHALINPDVTLDTARTRPVRESRHIKPAMPLGAACCFASAVAHIPPLAHPAATRLYSWTSSRARSLRLWAAPVACLTRSCVGSFAYPVSCGALAHAHEVVEAGDAWRHRRDRAARLGLGVVGLCRL